MLEVLERQPPPVERTGAGAAPGRAIKATDEARGAAARRRVGAPYLATVLGRVRFVTLLGALVMAAVLTFSGFTVPTAAPTARVLGDVLLICLCWRWLRDLERPDTSAIRDVVEWAAVLAVGVLHDPWPVLAFLGVALAYRSLFGSARAAAVRVVAYSVVFAAVDGAAAVSSTRALLLPALLLVIGAFSLVAALLHLVATALEANGQTQARDQVLGRASAAFAAASTRQEIIDEAIGGMRALLAETPGATGLLALGSPEHLSVVGATGAGQGRLRLNTVPESVAKGVVAGNAVCVKDDQASAVKIAMGLQLGGDRLMLQPVSLAGSLKGLLAIGSASALAQATRDALQRLASALALALGYVTATQQEGGDDRFRALVHNLPDALTVVGSDGVIRYQSPSAQRLLGFRPVDLIGTKFVDLLHSGDTQAARAFCAQAEQQREVTGPVVWRFHHQDGTWRELETVGRGLRGGESLRGAVLCTRDVTARSTLRDPLTDLVSKELFQDRLDQALIRARRGTGRVALLLVDVDKLNEINDRLGFAAGDKVLREVAKRLRGCSGEEDTVARLSGDRFALLCTEVGPFAESEALRRAGAVSDAMRPPIRVGTSEAQVTVGVGVATSPAEGGDPETLLRQAEGALQHAKSRSGGNVELAQPSDTAGSGELTAVTAPLQRALNRREFQLYYQPIANLQTGKIAGVEALVRWKHPDQGLQLPGTFLPGLEKSGLILPVGRWILREACEQIHVWQSQYPSHPPLTVAVNLSPVQFQQPDLPRQVAGALRDAGIDPKALVLEISADALQQGDDRLIYQLLRLKDLGVRLAVDDFAPGRGDPGSLAQLPLDVLKVDPSVIEWMAAGRGSEVMARLYTSRGSSSRWQMVAEGIERLEHLEGLSELGCELVQGHLFAKARGSEEMGALLLKASLSDHWLTTSPSADESAFWARMNHERKRELAVLTGAAQRTPSKPPVLRLLRRDH